MKAIKKLLKAFLLSFAVALSGCGGGGFAEGDSLAVESPIPQNPPEVATAGPVRLSFAFSPADVVIEQDASLPTSGPTSMGPVTYSKTFAAGEFGGDGARFNDVSATMLAFFKGEVLDDGSPLGFSDIIIEFSNGVKMVMTNKAAGNNANSFVGRLYEFLPLAGSGDGGDGEKYLKTVGRATGFVNGDNFDIALDFSSLPVSCGKGVTAATFAACPLPPPACGENCPSFLVQTSLSESVMITRTLNSAGTQATLTATGGVKWVLGSITPNAPVESLIENDLFDIVIRAERLDILSQDDYLHYGYWTNISPSFEQGGFAVGAPLPNDYQLPLIGTATYEGQAHGYFDSYIYADIFFTAKFNGNQTTMSGILHAGYNIVFQETTFSDGKFSGGAVVCGIGLCFGTLTDNTWEGAFFGKADSAKGNAPTKFGGTFQVSGVSLLDSSPGRLIGGFGTSLDTWTP